MAVHPLVRVLAADGLRDLRRAAVASVPLIVEHGRARWLSRDEYEDRYGEWPCREAQPGFGYGVCDGCGRQTDIALLEEGPGGGLVCARCQEQADE